MKFITPVTLAALLAAPVFADSYEKASAPTAGLLKAEMNAVVVAKADAFHCEVVGIEGAPKIKDTEVCALPAPIFGKIWGITVKKGS